MPTRLEKLRAKQAHLEAQIKDIEKREKVKQRKEDTRRKIIIGALVMTHMEKNKSSDFTRKVEALVNEYVTKPNERALFGLDPLEKNDNQGEGQAEAAQA